MYVRLTPNASTNQVVGLWESGLGDVRLKVKVTVVPEKGKANKALLKVLSRFLGYAQRDLTLVSGLTDRNKNILISGDGIALAEQLKTKIRTLF